MCRVFVGKRAAAGRQRGPPLFSLSLWLDALDSYDAEARVFAADLRFKLPVFSEESLEHVHVGEL